MNCQFCICTDTNKNWNNATHFVAKYDFCRQNNEKSNAVLKATANFELRQSKMLSNASLVLFINHTLLTYLHVFSFGMSLERGNAHFIHRLFIEYLYGIDCSLFLLLTLLSCSSHPLNLLSFSLLLSLYQLQSKVNEISARKQRFCLIIATLSHFIVDKNLRQIWKDINYKGKYNVNIGK